MADQKEKKTKRDTFAWDLEKLEEETRLYEEGHTSSKERDIIRTAERLFADKGYERTRTAEIAREANVTERTLFKYFRSKQDLVRRIMFPIVLRTVIPTQIKKVRSLLQNASNGPLEELLHTLINDRYETAVEHGSKIKIVLTEFIQNEQMRDRVRELWTKHVYQDVQKIIQGYQDRGVLRKDIRHTTIARTIIISVMAYVLLACVLYPQGKWDRKKDTDELIKILLDGVRSK